MIYKKKHTFIIPIIMIILLFFVIHRLVMKPQQTVFENIYSMILYPFLMLRHRLFHPLESWYSNYQKIDELQATVKTLTTTQKKLLEELIELHSLVWFTKKTAELINFKERYSLDNALLGQIIFKHFSEQEHFFLVDKGSRDGVVSDMVAVYNNCLIGRVIQAYHYYSKIILLTDKSCKIAACSPLTHMCGITQGCNNKEELNLCFVSHLEHIHENETIISNGEGLIFPAGFGIGIIKDFSVQGLCYDITLKTMVDVTKLEYCYLIQK